MQNRISKNYRFTYAKFAYAILSIVVVVFVTSRFYPLLGKIAIQTNSITDGETINSGVVEIFGQAKKATNLYINGKTTSVTKNGEFEDAIALPEGYNIVTITAVDKFGKTSNEIIKLNIGAEVIDTAMNTNKIINN